MMMKNLTTAIKRWHFLLFLMLFFALGLQTAVSKSATMDEPIHVLRGSTLWQTGDTRLQYEHAPLSHWAIGSLLQLEPSLPRISTLPSWKTAEHTVLANEFWNNMPSRRAERRVLLLARLSILFGGLLMGALLARWTHERQIGTFAEIVVMTLYAFSPNILAHLSLATTDGLLVVTFLAAVWSWERFWKRPSFKRLMLAALFLGFALATKLTALILPPVFLLLAYLSHQERWRMWAWYQPALLWAAMMPVAGLVVWAIYLFSVGTIAKMPLILPAADYIKSVLDLLSHTGGGHVAYLLGERSPDGWLYYFTIVAAVKTPLTTLILFVTAIVLLSRHHRWRQTAYLWLPSLSLFILASYGRLNIGYRHILPILPFIWLLIGETITYWQRWQIGRWLLFALLAWYTLFSLWQMPDYLPYFNEAVGGSGQGSRYLGDSNLDWGQDLPLLTTFAAEHESDLVGYSYFGPLSAAERAMAVTAEPMSLQSDTFYAANPSSGLYAISISHLQGVKEGDVDAFDWFRVQEPTSYLGYSIAVYDVTAAAGEWVAICEDPAAILAETAVYPLLGIENLRILSFDCRQSWPFPNDGAPGWYILPQQDSWPIPARMSQNTQRVYRHDAADNNPSYEIYYWDGAIDPVQVLTSGVEDAQFTDGHMVALPVAMGESIALLGYSVDEFTWQTVWQVMEETAVPLTIASHLYADQPIPIANADGLGFHNSQWRTGDVFVQYAIFEQFGGYLATGLYDYVTGERLESVGENGRFGEFVRLPFSQE